MIMCFVRSGKIAKIVTLSHETSIQVLPKLYYEDRDCELAQSRTKKWK